MACRSLQEVTTNSHTAAQCLLLLFYIVIWLTWIVPTCMSMFTCARSSSTRDYINTIVIVLPLPDMQNFASSRSCSCWTDIVDRIRTGMRMCMRQELYYGTNFTCRSSNKCTTNNSHTSAVLVVVLYCLVDWQGWMEQWLIIKHSCMEQEWMHQWWYNNIVFPYLNATFTHKKNVCKK
jgi:hypothetical protein